MKNKMTFKDLNLPEKLQNSLDKNNFYNPTPIQARAIPQAMEGHDILGSAQTGTGKSFAFIIPIIAKLINNEIESALIMAPTRELAKQIVTVVKDLMGKKMKLPMALLIGGDSYYIQNNQLKSNPKIIVGTPGRINDHLKRKSLKLSKTNFLVLDEMDRMIDIGFGEQIETIIAKMPAEKQTLMFSATINDKTAKSAEKYLDNPKVIEIESKIEPHKNIKQDFLQVTEAMKYDKLLAALDERDGSVVIFVKTKQRVEQVTQSLQLTDHSVNYIHGDLRQSQREKIIRKFKDKKFRVIVATDVVARGLDIEHVRHVINYDLPRNPEDYVHRIGRTGRAGAKGYSLSLISPQDRKLFRGISVYLNDKDKEQIELELGLDNKSDEGRRRRRRRGGKAKASGSGEGRKRKFSGSGDGEGESGSRRFSDKKKSSFKKFKGEKGKAFKGKKRGKTFTKDKNRTAKRK
jgi:superfamily II DNA/RNA helicase